MAPVFSRAAWHCAWHLIQNDLVHMMGNGYETWLLRL
ncbi:secretory carrier-associated membrane protein, partial [Tanacetum coccineum]